VIAGNDSDLEAPIRAVMQELGVPVGLLNPHPVWRRSRDLLNLDPVFFKQIRPNAVKNSQFPDVLTDANGTFRRPATAGPEGYLGWACEGLAAAQERLASAVPGVPSVLDTTAHLVLQAGLEHAPASSWHGSSVLRVVACLPDKEKSADCPKGRLRLSDQAGKCSR
jgi:hypothetical protein